MYRHRCGIITRSQYIQHEYVRPSINTIQNKNFGILKRAPPLFTLDYKNFVDLIDNGKIGGVEIIRDTNTMNVYTENAENENVVIPSGKNIEVLSKVLKNNVVVTYKDNPWSYNNIILYFFEFMMVGSLIGLMFQIFGKNKTIQNPFKFGESTAVDDYETDVKFNDVAGLKNAKQDLQEIVEFLKNPEKFARLGAKIPKGCLLTGPSGVGKTLLAKAVAGEAGVPFFAASGSEFIQMFVGTGASRIRDIFQKAAKKAPSIIFIDEIDAIARQRSSNINGSSDERDQTINQLLTEMDGFKTNNGVIVIGATNRVDILDPAVLRPGRFDRIINTELPDYKDRVAILGVHTVNKPLDDNVSLDTIARITTGFSGADLANLANEAAILAARNNQDTITKEDFHNSLEKISLGAKRDIIVTDDKKKVISYHEAGHALVAMKIGDFDSVQTVSIIPRGKTGGVTIFQPDDSRLDSGLVSREYLENQIAVALGGRISEEIVFGSDKITTGASGDIAMVQNISRHMITQYGMNLKLGPIAWNSSNKLDNSFAESTLTSIDDEIKKMVTRIYEKTKTLLIDNRKALDAIAKALLEKEVIDGDELKDIVGSI